MPEKKQKRQPTGDYEVGYCRPPKKHQFRKGNSGNLNGRQKGTKNLKTDLLEEMNEMLTVNEGGRKRRISKQRALVKAQVANAIKGDPRAAAKIFDLCLKLLGLDQDDADANKPLTEDEHAIFEVLAERIQRRIDQTKPSGRDADSDDDDSDGVPA